LARKWDWQIEGWQDKNREWHEGEPPGTVDGWFGVIVHVSDPDDPEDEQYKRIMHPVGWQDWTELYGDIWRSFAMNYGIELA